MQQPRAETADLNHSAVRFLSVGVTWSHVRMIVQVQREERDTVPVAVSPLPAAAKTIYV